MRQRAPHLFYTTLHHLYKTIKSQSGSKIYGQKGSIFFVGFSIYFSNLHLFVLVLVFAGHFVCVVLYILSDIVVPLHLFVVLCTFMLF